MDLEVTERESNRVRRKIDVVILPIFFITQALQFMDRTALNYANLFDYQNALGLKGTQFNYLSAMIYAGYFFGQYPCGWLIGRFPAQKVLGISCLLWGLMVILLTQCRNYSSALAVRFLMGLFEAACTPGLTLMTGFWYTRREIPLRQCIWYSSLGIGGIVGSYISMGISRLPEDLTPERWELIFFILGGATMIWSFVLYFLLADSPANARFLDERERVIAVKRVAANSMGIKNKHFNRKQAWVSFYDPKAILVFVSVFAAYAKTPSCCPVSVLIALQCHSQRGPKLVFHRHHSRSGLLNDENHATEVRRGCRAGDRPDDRWPDHLQRPEFTPTHLDRGQRPVHRRRRMHGLPSTVQHLGPPRLFLADQLAIRRLHHLPHNHLLQHGRLHPQIHGECHVLVSAPPQSITTTKPGPTSSLTSPAAHSTAYCWGNFVGPFVVKQSEAPNYPSATAGLLAGYSIKMGCHVLLLAYMFFMNRRRDRVYGPAKKEASNEAGMRDMTEFENRDFRYVL